MSEQVKRNSNNLSRIFKYYYFKFIRQSGEPEYIARGVALGLFVGMIVPFGFQIITAVPLAIWLKAAKIPSIAFTFVTNHLTIWVIYPVQCYVGSWLIARPLGYGQIRDSLKDVIEKQSFQDLFSLGWILIIAFFAGGLLFALALSIPGYFISLKMIILHRLHKEKKQHKSRKKYGVIKSKDTPDENIKH
jgi:uncharacterized protein